MGMLALIGGLWSGLLRLGWAGPFLHPRLPDVHGPLMICGFLGTVISLERAVALDRTWAYLAPAMTGAGGLMVLAGFGGALGPLLVTVGSVTLVAIFGVVLSIQAAPFAVVMAGGAGAWAVGNALWLGGGSVHGVVPWWIGFLVLTIAGERLELSRMLFHARWTRWLFLGLVGFLGLGMSLSVSAPDLGFRGMGVGLGAIALWLTVYDVARRTVQETGLPRFIAVCLLAGYAWLLVGGVFAFLFGNPGGGLFYDATLHAVFVGFVFSMIFGHAPVIFPSVLGISIPYRPTFYVHVGLLHASLVLRLVGDLLAIGRLRWWGAWLNAGAILIFLALTAFSALRGTEKEDASAGRPTRLHVDGAPVEEESAGSHAPTADIPDLQLETE